jgi:transcriptional regulator with XRE-family HTH domain
MMLIDTERIRKAVIATKRENLRRLREEADMSQKELATKVGLSTIMVRKIEDGSRNPSFDTMAAYMDVFKRKPAELFPEIFLRFVDTKRTKEEAR